MYIDNLSIFMKSSSVPSQVSIAVTKKILDSANENSQALIQSISSIGNTDIGSNLDVRS